MTSFKIEGGHKLKGIVTPQGAKNEALQILCAVLLTQEKVIVNNVPDILDVKNLILILKKLGVKVINTGSNSYLFQSDKINLSYLKTDKYRTSGSSLRGSIMIVGALLSRFGKGYIGRPGGDKIGRRKLDTHFKGLIKLGAKFKYNKEENFYSVEAEKLYGTYILLDEASVTGTANIIMASVLAIGKTTIYNAACEPYVQQLCKMLNSMGAKISGIGSNLLTIEGVKYLTGCEHTVLPDMIEIGSWIGLVAMTRSELTIKNVGWKNLGQIPDVFKKIGIALEKKDDDIYIPEHSSYQIQNYIDDSILTISDAPWPGFTPDLLSIILVVVTQAKGTVLVHQKMFESRLFFIDRLIDMGAKIILCDPHRATVIGQNFNSQLKAINMVSPDIRAGIALLIAALSAKGTSIISNIEQIDRGYESIEKKLKSIGAKIERI